MLEFRTILAGDAEGIAAVREMFEEYQRELGVDLCFQSFQEELETLPGKYGPPSGVLYLGFQDGELAACGALRPLEAGVSEVKRVYVRPAFRRMGIARALSERLVADAVTLGYEVVKLDTLERLTGALAMYRSLGFTEIPAYNFNPEPDIVYMQKRLIRG
jgi:GNAT superfamily N-acetyltransferase